MSARDQFRGFWRNFKRFVVEVKPSQILPPFIWGTIAYYARSVPIALGLMDGRADSNQMFTAAVALIIAAVLSSLVSAGLTLVFVGLLVWLVVIAVLRWFPAFDKVWKKWTKYPSKVAERLYRLIFEWDL